MTKVCTKCKQPRQIPQMFYTHPGTRDGFRPDCKLCFSAAVMRWKAANREKVLGYGRERTRMGRRRAAPPA